jgi:hypothetical protein
MAKYSPVVASTIFRSGTSGSFVDYTYIYDADNETDYFFGYYDCPYGTASVITGQGYGSSNPWVDQVWTKRKIIKVEVGLRCRITVANLKVSLRPKFNGSTTGTYKDLPVSTSIGTHWYDITFDSFAPTWETINDIINLDLDVKTENTTTTGGKRVEIYRMYTRVTYISKGFKDGSIGLLYTSGAQENSLGGDSDWVNPNNAFEAESGLFATNTRTAAGTSRRLVGQVNNSY